MKTQPLIPRSPSWRSIGVRKKDPLGWRLWIFLGNRDVPERWQKLFGDAWGDAPAAGIDPRGKIYPRSSCLSQKGKMGKKTQGIQFSPLSHLEHPAPNPDEERAPDRQAGREELPATSPCRGTPRRGPGKHRYPEEIFTDKEYPRRKV